MSAHRNYYTCLYRRKQWLKHLVSDTVWAIRNRVRKLHYIERIDHLYDKNVNTHIHVTQLSFIILFCFFLLKILKKIKTKIDVIRCHPKGLL